MDMHTPLMYTHIYRHMYVSLSLCLCLSGSVCFCLSLFLSVSACLSPREREKDCFVHSQGNSRFLPLGSCVLPPRNYSAT